MKNKDMRKVQSESTGGRGVITTQLGGGSRSISPNSYGPKEEVEIRETKTTTLLPTLKNQSNFIQGEYVGNKKDKSSQKKNKKKKESKEIEVQQVDKRSSSSD